MTLNEVYLEGKSILKSAKIESFSFDTMKIFEFCFNFGRQDIILFRNTVADSKKLWIFWAYQSARKRKAFTIYFGSLELYGLQV